MEGPHDHLVVFSPSENITYYFLAAWEQEKNGLTSQEEFVAVIDAQLQKLEEEDELYFRLFYQPDRTFRADEELKTFFNLDHDRVRLVFDFDFLGFLLPTQIFALLSCGMSWYFLQYLLPSPFTPEISSGSKDTSH